MATPRNKYPDPREAFGFAPLLLSDYFNVPQGAASNPAFGPAARGLFAAEDAYRQEQQSLERDRAAQREGDLILDTAGSMSDEGIRDWLLENPRVIGTPQGQQVLGYMQTREQMRKLSKSDQDLGVSFSETIEDPALRASFQGYMTQGIPFAEARDRYYVDRNNQQQAMKLAEAGIAEDEVAALTDPNGRINPVAVARRLADERRRREMADGTTPIDRNIQMLQGAIRSRTGVLKESGADVAADPQIQGWMRELDDLYVRSLESRAPQQPGTTAPATIGTTGLPVLPGTTPAPAPTAPAATPQQAAPEVQQQAFIEAVRSGKTAEEFRKEREAAQKQTAESQAVDQAWTDAKTKVAETMNQMIPDPQERILEAQAILSDRTVDAGPRTKMGSPQLPYWTKYSNRDRNRFGFKEPGNLRTGSQSVGDDEVLQAWARDLLQATGLLEVTNPEQQVAPAAAPSETQRKADEIVARLLTQQKQ
jgi:hypothetical protein